jgi:hypothetical protein
VSRSAPACSARRDFYGGSLAFAGTFVGFAGRVNALRCLRCVALGEPGFVGGDHEMDPVASAPLREDAARVSLGGQRTGDDRPGRAGREQRLPAATVRMASSSAAGRASLDRNPHAPARRPRSTLVSVSNVVRISTLVPLDPSSAKICRVASMPSVLGILMSIKTTSGRRFRVSVTASSPVPGSPHDLHAISGVDQQRERAAHRAQRDRGDDDGNADLDRNAVTETDHGGRSEDSHSSHRHQRRPMQCMQRRKALDGDLVYPWRTPQGIQGLQGHPQPVVMKKGLATFPLVRPCFSVEPPVGIEPTTFSLRETRKRSSRHSARLRCNACNACNHPRCIPGVRRG